MATDEMRVERDGRVMVVTLDRPQDQNRLTRDVLIGLQDIVDRLATDDEAQAVIITGSGRAFSM
jgi:enoyl-CoA hydratase/carnithine racemase